MLKTDFIASVNSVENSLVGNSRINPLPKARTLEGYIVLIGDREMKLKLPHKTYDLDMTLECEDRIPIIDNLLKDEIEFHSETMTTEEYFRHTWEKKNTIICLDIIGYYLTKEKRNLEILSTKKQLEMETGSKRHTTFSGMGLDNQVKIGVVEEEGY